MDMFDSFVRELFAECHDVRVREYVDTNYFYCGGGVTQWLVQ
jgi:hypothetical protein